jgi:predicted amidophosphoribosyltransferase
VQKNTDGGDFTVAIIDDVLTTGVTVNTLSKRLKQRYPKIHIQVWAAAFTPPPKSSLFQKT